MQFLVYDAAAWGDDENGKRVAEALIADPPHFALELSSEDLGGRLVCYLHTVNGCDRMALEAGIVPVLIQAVGTPAEVRTPAEARTVLRNLEAIIAAASQARERVLARLAA